MKKCNSCLVRKNISEFYKHSGCSDGHRPDCKSCYGLKNKHIYHRDNRRYRNSIYKRLYGITILEYEKLLKNQKNKCAICSSKKATPKANRNFFVDHCHKTGKVRGLLCINCNKGLGHFKDNKNALKNAIKYLTN